MLFAKARRYNQQSLVPRAHARGPTGSTSSPRSLWPVSECPQGPPAVPVYSVLCPRARSVDQMSWATLAFVRRPAVSSSSPGRFGPVNEGTRCLSVVWGDLGPGRGARGIDQCSRATHVRVRGPALSSSCPGQHPLVSEVPRCPLAVREIRARVSVPMGSTAVRDNSCPDPRDCSFDPLCSTTPTWVRVLAVSTSLPGRLTSGSKGPRFQPQVPGDSGLGPSACRVDQVSRATRARVRLPAGSIRIPG